MRDDGHSPARDRGILCGGMPGNRGFLEAGRRAAGCSAAALPVRGAGGRLCLGEMPSGLAIPGCRADHAVQRDRAARPQAWRAICCLARDPGAPLAVCGRERGGVRPRTGRKRNDADVQRESCQATGDCGGQLSVRVGGRNPCRAAGLPHHRHGQARQCLPDGQLHAARGLRPPDPAGRLAFRRDADAMTA